MLVSNTDDNGNVVIGYTTDSHLCLDCDMQRKEGVIEFMKKYASVHDLGSALVGLTSVVKQLTFDGNILNNYCIIFGKTLSWEEIQWHIDECRRLRIINRSFAEIRKFGSITIRVNAKNDEKPFPKIVSYFSNGDNRGVMAFLRHWVMCRNLGR